MMMQQQEEEERVDAARLAARVQHYAARAGASPDSIRSMLAMLRSPLGQAIIQQLGGGGGSGHTPSAAASSHPAPAATPATTPSSTSTSTAPAPAPLDVSSLPNADLYKVHMQSMYAQFLTGVTADFALNIRRGPRLTTGSRGSSVGGSGSSQHSSGSSQRGPGSGSSSQQVDPSSQHRPDGTSSSSSLSPSVYVLTDVQEQHPHIFSALTERISRQLQSRVLPLHPAVLEALAEFNGYQPPQALLDRLAAPGGGMAPVCWVEVEGAPVAVASGPIEAASNTETNVMQAVQQAVIQAAAAQHCRQQQQQQQQQQHCTGSAGSNDSAHAPSAGVQQPQPLLLDRTERLANSLGRMVWVVQRLNEMQHGFKIMLMAGRRSTDLLHLVLQNLYFMQHVAGYTGTSSLLAAALLRHLLLLQPGYADSAQLRRQLVGRVTGTHAHEMTSMQQLMFGYDEEAGRRCGLQVPVCITQLLSHLLFLTANGGGSSSSSSSDGGCVGGCVCGTALPDTFTTPYFVQLAEMTQPPPEFLADMVMWQRWGIGGGSGSGGSGGSIGGSIGGDSGSGGSGGSGSSGSSGSGGGCPLSQQQLEAVRVFDLFSVWRLDSGSYPELAQLIFDAWARRNTARAASAAGLAPLPPLQLLHSNISSLEDIQELTCLPPHIRPSMLGFGGLADGFMPFEPAAESDSAGTSAHHQLQQPHDQKEQEQQQQRRDTSSSRPSTAAAPSTGPTAASHALAAPPAPPAPPHSSVCLPTCSLVMKAVQARLTQPPPALQGRSSCSSSPAAAAAAAAASTAATQRPTATAAAAAILASCQQPCAVKLGDGGLRKAQTDPRLPAATRQAVLTRMQDMVRAAALPVGLDEQRHGGVLSQVLREAYLAVVRQGVLKAGTH